METRRKLRVFKVRSGPVGRTDGNRDFASLLDELIAGSLRDQAEPGRPTIPFDYLSVADELHSGRIRVSPDLVAAEYAEADATAEKLFAAADTAATEAELPSIEPEAIWKELALTDVARLAELSRKRRAFAFKNHPDRVVPHLRQRAMVRMQIANMLIDEMERRARR
jgi:hypothetical protein